MSGEKAISINKEEYNKAKDKLMESSNDIEPEKEDKKYDDLTSEVVDGFGGCFNRINGCLKDFKKMAELDVKKMEEIRDDFSNVEETYTTMMEKNK